MVGKKIPARGFYEKLHIEYMMNNLLTAHLPLLGFTPSRRARLVSGVPGSHARAGQSGRWVVDEWVGPFRLQVHTFDSVI